MNDPFYAEVPTQNNRRSRKMENMAFSLGLLGLVLFCLVYPPLICGSLAITFALLSRGGTTTMAPRAKTALLLGSIALGLILLMFVYTIAVANLYYGGLENMMREVYGSLGIDYDMIMRSLE